MIFVTKKSYEIYQPIQLIPASLINFEYILSLVLVTPHTPHPYETLSTPPSSFTLSEMLLSMKKSWRNWQFFTRLWIKKNKPNGHTTSNPGRYYIDTSKTNFRRISTSLPRTFFDVISLVEKSMLFSRTSFDVISMVEKSTLFPRTFFDVISMVEKSTLFPRTFFDAIFLVEMSALFLLTFFDVNLMGKNSTSFLVSCKVMKTFEKVFLYLKL